MNSLASAGITAFILIFIGFLIWWFLMRPKNGDKCYPKDDDLVDGVTVYTLKGGKCTPNACATGFTFDSTSNTCSKDITPDPIIPGTSCTAYVGSDTSNTHALTFKIGQSEECDEIASCNTESGHLLINGSCVKNLDACTPYEWQGASTGTAIVIDGTTGICNPDDTEQPDATGQLWTKYTVSDGILAPGYQIPAHGGSIPSIKSAQPAGWEDIEVNSKCSLGEKPANEVTYVHNTGYLVDGNNDSEKITACIEKCPDDECKGVVYINNAAAGKANCFKLTKTPTIRQAAAARSGAVCASKERFINDTS